MLQAYQPYFATLLNKYISTEEGNDFWSEHLALDKLLAEIDASNNLDPALFNGTTTTQFEPEDGSSGDNFNALNSVDADDTQGAWSSVTQEDPSASFIFPSVISSESSTSKENENEQAINNNDGLSNGAPGLANETAVEDGEAAEAEVCTSNDDHAASPDNSLATGSSQNDYLGGFTAFMPEELNSLAPQVLEGAPLEVNSLSSDVLDASIQEDFNKKPDVLEDVTREDVNSVTPGVLEDAPLEGFQFISVFPSPNILHDEDPNLFSNFLEEFGNLDQNQL
jgi:hypothetical protein